MGGFSQATNDYIDLAFTFNTATHEWVTKHMGYKIQNGHRLDLSCYNVNWNSDFYS